MKTANLALLVLLAGAAGVVSAQGPTNYPEETPSLTAKTRAQVNAELAEARRLGQIVYGEVDVPSVESPMVATKTRAQVNAELAEARRLGLVVYGEADSPIATPEQERMIAEAGRRAVAHEVASK